MSIMDPTGETCDHEWIYDADMTERECMACGKSQYRGIEHDDDRWEDDESRASLQWKSRAWRDESRERGTNEGVMPPSMKSRAWRDESREWGTHEVSCPLQ